MTRKQGHDGAEVHRLLDIVVEEVSLVDRAANQHQFLIVKRSDMSQSKENKEGKDGAADASKAAKADAATMRTAAVAALETLTAAVEQLGEGGDLDAEALNEVAGELRQVVEQLAEAAGADASKAGGKKPKDDDAEGKDGQQSAGKEKADKDEEDEEEEDDGDAQQSKSRDLLKSVRDLVSKLSDTLTATSPQTSGAGGASRAVSPADEVAQKLGEIAQTLKEQSQRLSKLEKAHGLPNSTPRSERSGRGDENSDKVSWSLNLNNPQDRESVDKELSFHTIRGGV